MSSGRCCATVASSAAQPQLDNTIETPFPPNHPFGVLGMSSRALSFGVKAEAYERFRPRYPVELFDMVMTYAGQPVRTALEIGAGTGKATRLFAQEGVTVTATEPDGAMLAELRKHAPAKVKTVQATFEDLRPGESHGLVYAAAALHWTNPEGRWSRMTALLEPGGVFASFGGPAHLVDPAAEEAVRAARAPFLESDEVPSPDGTPPGHDMQWPGTELQRFEWFADVQQFVIERRMTMRARDYVGPRQSNARPCERHLPAGPFGGAGRDRERAVWHRGRGYQIRTRAPGSSHISSVAPTSNAA
jgi:SAM-dependent methyltransferase